MELTRDKEINQVSIRHVCLILHPKAGEDETVDEAIASLRRLGHKIDVCRTNEPGDAKRFASEAAADNRVDTIVAGGGDGTINEVVNGMCADGRSPQCALGILPLGTANDFASTFGIPLGDPAAALEFIVTCGPIPIDVGRVNGRLFLNIVSGGYGAEITTATPGEMKQLLGGFAYFLTGVVNVGSITAKPARIKGPGFSWEGDILGIAVGNGRQAGGGFKVTPEAEIDDRLLDLLIIPEVPWTDLFDLISELTADPKLSEREATIYRQLAWVEVDAPDGLQINLDGEPLSGEHFRFDLLEQPLLCHLPEEMKAE